MWYKKSSHIEPYSYRKPEKSVVALVHRKDIPGDPGNYDNKGVDVVKGMLKEALDYLGGVKSFVRPGDRVLIKPNIVYPYLGEGWEDSIYWCTDPRAVEALIKLIREEVPDVRQIFVSDSPASNKMADPPVVHDANIVMETTGMAAACRRAGADMLDLEFGSPLVRVEIPDAHALKSFQLPTILREVDCLITFPKLKNHLEAVMTLGIKNAQGYFAREDKEHNHANDLHQKFVDVLGVVYPHLTIIEGLIGIQGTGPVTDQCTGEDQWQVVKGLNCLVASRDIVAADSVAAAVSGKTWDVVPTTRLADAQGFGNARPENIEIKGAKVDDVKKQFVYDPVYRSTTPILHDLYGRFENVVVYSHGACPTGCLSILNMRLAIADRLGLLQQLKAPINIVVGYNTYVPTHVNKGRTIVVGDCTLCQHAGKGWFLEIQGCPSFPNLASMVDAGVMQLAAMDNGQPVPPMPKPISPPYKPFEGW